MKRIDIYDEISPWGFSLMQLKEEMQTDEEEIEMHINSPGGSVFEGIAIYNNIKNSGKKVTCYVDGIAASIASVIAMAADVLIMPENSFLMIHNPWTLSIGEAENLRNDADLLDKIKSVIIPAYSERSNLSNDEIIEMMNAETWLTGKEAKEKGFADFDNEKISVFKAHSAMNKYVAKIENIPENILNADKTEIPETEAVMLKYSDEEYKKAVDESYDSGLFAGENKGNQEYINKITELENKQKEFLDKISAIEEEKTHLETRLNELSNGLKAPEEKITFWNDAVNSLGYVEARKKHPELYSDYMKK